MIAHVCEEGSSNKYLQDKPDNKYETGQPFWMYENSEIDFPRIHVQADIYLKR